MNHQSEQNKKAWEYRAYEFWHERDGAPKEKAEHIMGDPLACLKKHKHYFADVQGKHIANLCGSNGRKAVPLALLGANVTVFDISLENKRYAMELADWAGVSIDYVVGDIYDIDLAKYGACFDMLYLEGGILHYFDDIKRLMGILCGLLKKDGCMVLSDYHPLRRYFLDDGRDADEIDYFDEGLHESDIAYKQSFTKEEQADFPDVMLRSYTLSEIINAAIGAGFTIKEFLEHKGWENENIPWEFTIKAKK